MARDDYDDEDIVFDQELDLSMDNVIVVDNLPVRLPPPEDVCLVNGWW